MARFSASRSPEVSGRETRNMERSRKIASQGMVLLKNNGALPMTEAGKKIALFGNGARRTVKGGTGSAFHRPPGAVAEQGDLLTGFRHGQRAVVLQKHHALGRDLSGTLHVPGLPAAHLRTP